MKERLSDAAIGLLAGVVLAGALTTVCADRRLKRVQEFSHQAATSAAAITARARANAEMQRARADSLAAARRPVIRQVERDTAAAALAERSLANARTVRDTNVALRLENQALRAAVVNLYVALQQSDQIIAVEHARGDSLAAALQRVNEQLQSVNRRVQALMPRPKWFRYSVEATKIGGAIYAGYQWGKHER